MIAIIVLEIWASERPCFIYYICKHELDCLGEKPFSGPSMRSGRAFIRVECGVYAAHPNYARVCFSANQQLQYPLYAHRINTLKYLAISLSGFLLFCRMEQKRSLVFLEHLLQEVLLLNGMHGLSTSGDRGRWVSTGITQLEVLVALGLGQCGRNAWSNV